MDYDKWYSKTYYQAHREAILEKRRAYHIENREKIAARQKAYRQANREKFRAYSRKHREKRKKEAEQDALYQGRAGSDGQGGCED